MRRSEAYLSALIESTEDFVWSVDLNYRLLTLNRALSEGFLRDYGVRAAVGMGPADLLPPARAALFLALYERALKEGSFQEKYTRVGGRTLEMVFNPIVHDGETIGISVFGKDITEREAAEAARREAEDDYQRLFEGAIDGIYRTSLAGDLLGANPALASMLGYDSVEDLVSAVADTARQVWADPDERLEFLRLVEAQEVVRRHECRLKRKDGTTIWVLLAGRKVRQRGGRPAGYEGFLEDITERKHAVAKAESVREEERGRLARAIHDELGQALTAIKIDASALLRNLPVRAQERARRCRSIMDLADGAIQSVWRISTELRPGVLDDLGLAAAVEWAAQDFAGHTGMKCALETPREDLAIDPEAATALYRILREALTNIARHAEATEFGVRLAEDDGGLRLEVRDNGRGFHEAQLAHGRSLGILGMRERALRLDGRLTIASSPGEGAAVIAWIPAGRRKAQGSD